MRKDKKSPTATEISMEFLLSEEKRKMQKDCDHKIGWKYGYECGDFVYENYSGDPDMIGEKFVFCPDCGAKIDWENINGKG